MRIQLGNLKDKLKVLKCVGVCMCRFCDVWVCVYVGFVMCGCVYV